MDSLFKPFINLVLRFPYPAEFLLLLACGLGLPIPEEVTLITGGYICWKYKNSLWATIVICMGAIILGDYLMFLLGQRYGKQVLRARWFRRMLTRRKLARVTLYFRRFGVKTVFFARFFAGIRVPVYFIAGAHRMRSLKFIWLDFLGALLSVPISIWAGRHFGNDIEHAIKVMKKVKFELAIAILAGALVYALYLYFTKPRRQAKSEDEAILKETPLP